MFTKSAKLNTPWGVCGRTDEGRVACLEGGVEGVKGMVFGIVSIGDGDADRKMTISPSSPVCLSTIGSANCGGGVCGGLELNSILCFIY